jgi:protein YibB
MSTNTLVTAFFDIGRGHWGGRSNDWYLDCFARLAVLDNPMIVYTQDQFRQRIIDLRGDKPTQVFNIDLEHCYYSLYQRVNTVCQNPVFKNKLHPSVNHVNSKFDKPWYILVTLIKTDLVSQATNHSETQRLSWIDFGYVRDSGTLYSSTRLEYDFDPDKIYCVAISDPFGHIDIPTVIAHNITVIPAGFVSATKENWLLFDQLCKYNIEQLLNQDLIDVEQTVWLMTVRQRPDLFSIKFMENNDWFSIFKDIQTWKNSKPAKVI